MEAYEVKHRTTEVFYYLLADSAVHAIEIVTLRLGDSEGATAWTAALASPALRLDKGVVFDASGKPVVDTEA